MAHVSIGSYWPYTYSPLTSQDSIRLVKVVPELIQNSLIGCIISEHPRSQENIGRVEYRALSYLWGDPAPSRRIGLKNGTVPGSEWHLHYIHVNLWLFLAHMWRKEQFECLLWTDRLCLNQENEEEMAQQVPRMGLIYSQAERVVIWLGLSAWQEQNFQELRDWFKSEAYLGQNEFMHPWDHRDHPLRPRTAMHPWDHPPRRRMAIVSILDHEYWNRMWIMQEVAMAQKVVVEMQDIPSCTLQQMHDTIQVFMAGFSGFHMDRLFEMRGYAGTEPMASWELVWDHYKRLSTRPHDVIYGLLGLVRDDDPLRQIAVDYDKPASYVLFDALFMVSTPWLSFDKNDIFIQALMELELLKDVNSLEEYSHADHSWKLTESKVVKTFARISLEVIDALNLIMATSDVLEFSLNRHTMYRVDNLGAQIASLEPPGVDEFQWKAIVGIILTMGMGRSSKKAYEQWKKVRWPKLKRRSLWLCAEHALPTPFLRPLVPKRAHVALDIALLMSGLRLNDIAKACANYRQHEPLCEGSKMILDVPGSRTRLELDYATGRACTVGLNMWFQTGPSGSA